MKPGKYLSQLTARGYEPCPKFRFDPHRPKLPHLHLQPLNFPFSQVASQPATSLQFPILLKGEKEKERDIPNEQRRVSFDMATGDSKDMLKNVDWKTVGETGTSTTTTSSSTPIVKKRLPKKMRHVPDYYFMPRLSRPKDFVIYGACIAAGIGAGMLGEISIKKKIKAHRRSVTFWAWMR
ncbi:krueppel-like factor [Rhynchospora pubera]|uniref:Krueppel-like factor n=1 Tax=Rhynchospora pubera TaxID=906938 RepID=A0AAV8D181_9POAL|nr:krueppel-like factor [Rhynchospora pubera]